MPITETDGKGLAKTFLRSALDSTGSPATRFTKPHATTPFCGPLAVWTDAPSTRGPCAATAPLSCFEQ
jgi:hypothetical protein